MLAFVPCLQPLTQVIQGFSESLQHYAKMLKANCLDHSIYGAQAGLYNCT